MRWRFIDLGCVDNVFAAAVFEAVMKAVKKDLVDDTVLFWRPSKPAIYLGYHQLAHEEVHVGLCRKRGIPIVRRVLGGGTGYSDRNQIIYNIIYREDNPDIPYGPRNVYRFILGGVVKALHILGIADATVDEERFGVYANGKKISGSGQITSQGVVNSGGSLLVDFDFTAMSELLKDPIKNLKKGVEKPMEGMTYLKNEVDDITIEKAKTALRNGFEEILDRMYDGELTSYELELAGELRGKYLKEEWIFRADMRKEKRGMRER
ncbi:MAG: biotin/lipoate A/B protein ligase family protein [Candidatus Altiarchaeota archaeon]|nr:biotin/lipoate A/B protein ligase family protein [Candidatus Altiarchaeota archaeon]